MYFTLPGQQNSLESWKDKLRSDVNIPTGIMAVDLNVSRPIIFQVDKQLSKQRLRELIDIGSQNTYLYSPALLNKQMTQESCALVDNLL